MRYRNAQVLVRIYRRIVNANFVVQVWTSAAAALSDKPDHVASANCLAFDDRKVGKVPVQRRDAVTMIEDNGAAITVHEIGEQHSSVGRRDHWAPIGGRDINTAVKRPFSVKWIDALSEGTGNASLNRPQGGSVGSLDPVRGGYVAN